MNSNSHDKRCGGSVEWLDRRAVLLGNSSVSHKPPTQAGLVCIYNYPFPTSWLVGPPGFPANLVEAVRFREFSQY